MIEIIAGRRTLAFDVFDGFVRPLWEISHLGRL